MRIWHVLVLSSLLCTYALAKSSSSGSHGGDEDGGHGEDGSDGSGRTGRIPFVHGPDGSIQFVNCQALAGIIECWQSCGCAWCIDFGNNTAGCGFLDDNGNLPGCGIGGNFTHSPPGVCSSASISINTLGETLRALVRALVRALARALTADI